MHSVGGLSGLLGVWVGRISTCPRSGHLEGVLSHRVKPFLKTKQLLLPASWATLRCAVQKSLLFPRIFCLESMPGLSLKPPHAPSAPAHVPRSHVIWTRRVFPDAHSHPRVVQKEEPRRSQGRTPRPTGLRRLSLIRVFDPLFAEGFYFFAPWPQDWPRYLLWPMRYR